MDEEMVEKLGAALEDKMRELGCTDDCDTCKLEFCAREAGWGFIGDFGSGFDLVESFTPGKVE